MTPETDSIEWLDLDTGEEVRWTGRPGVAPVVPFFVIGVGIGLFGLFLASLLTSPSSPFRFVLIGLFVGLGLFVAGWRSAEHRSVAYAITTDAVYEKRGSAAADVSRTPLDAVESASVEQSALAGMLGRATVRCYTPTADRTTLALEGISDPEEVSVLLTDRRGTTALDFGLDRSDAAGHAVSAYVVDATDHVVLLRAFTDGSATDLERGRRVSLTFRPDPDSSLESAHGSDFEPDSSPRSDADRDRDHDHNRDRDAESNPEPSDALRVGREGDDGSDEDQFVWGDASADDGTVVNDGENPDSDSDGSDADSDRDADGRR